MDVKVSYERAGFYSKMIAVEVSEHQSSHRKKVVWNIWRGFLRLGDFALMEREDMDAF